MSIRLKKIRFIIGAFLLSAIDSFFVFYMYYYNMKGLIYGMIKHACIFIMYYMDKTVNERKGENEY